jgi:hypothetical protein
MTIKIVRKIAYLFMAMALLDAWAVPAASSASADTAQCSIAVPNVAITKPYTLIKATLGANCAAWGEDWADWGNRHSYYGPNGSFFFDVGKTTVYNGFYDWEHIGTYLVEPDSAYDVNSNTLTQNTTSYAVRQGSALSLSGTRSGSAVTLRAYNSYWSLNGEAYWPWRGHGVSFQYKRCATCVWSGLKNTSTASNGVATAITYSASSLYFRAFAGGTTTVWSATSGTVLR